jgi:hypothetical protein
MWNHEGDFRYAVVVRKCKSRYDVSESETRPEKMRGKSGQTSRVSLAGFPGVQQSLIFRRRGDPKMMILHHLQSCTSFYHFSVPGVSNWYCESPTSKAKSNISSGISSGSTSIGVT